MKLRRSGKEGNSSERDDLAFVLNLDLLTSNLGQEKQNVCYDILTIIGNILVLEIITELLLPSFSCGILRSTINKTQE